jgi:hypothetical protein
VRTASGDQDSPGVVRRAPEEGDFEEALRRALRCAADRVEPTGDGLTRIFRRLAAPWPARQASLLVTDCVDLLQLITIWLQPMSARALSVLAAAGGSVHRALRRLTSPVAGAAATDSVQDRSGPGRVPVLLGRCHALAAGARLRAVAWLRPALAAAVTAIVVLTGTVALSQTVARMELSETQPAGISALAGPAPPTGDQRQYRAGGAGGPGLSQVTPARGAPPAGGGAATHQRSCADTSCRSESAGSATPRSSAEPSTSARPSPAPTPKHARHQHDSHQPHQHHSGPAGGPGH